MAVAAVICLGAGQAHAQQQQATGYVCSITWFSANSIPFSDGYHGDFGSINVVMSSGPGCSGNFNIAPFYLYSTNAHGQSIDASMIFSEVQLSAQYQALTAAMLANRKVSISTNLGVQNRPNLMLYSIGN
jgi:hypothetical protein